MINHQTNEVFFDDLRVPAENLIGEEGQGFRYILDGMNAERILVSRESLGDARYFIETRVGLCQRARGVRPADRPEPGHPVPDRARLCGMEGGRPDGRARAAALFEAGKPCGEEANIAKLLASEAAWHAGEACMQTLRRLRGRARIRHRAQVARVPRMSQIAPISTNLILAYLGQHVLGMPRSY